MVHLHISALLLALMIVPSLSLPILDRSAIDVFTRNQGGDAILPRAQFSPTEIQQLYEQTWVHTGGGEWPRRMREVLGHLIDGEEHPEDYIKHVRGLLKEGKITGALSAVVAHVVKLKGGNAPDPPAAPPAPAAHAAPAPDPALAAHTASALPGDVKKPAGSVRATDTTVRRYQAILPAAPNDEEIHHALDAINARLARLKAGNAPAPAAHTAVKPAPGLRRYRPIRPAGPLPIQLPNAFGTTRKAPDTTTSELPAQQPKRRRMEMEENTAAEAQVPASARA